MVVPLFVGRQRSIKALEEATQKQGLIFFPRRRTPKPTSPPKKISTESVLSGTVVQMLKLPDGTVKVLIEGKKRAKIAGFADNPDFFLVDVEDAPRGERTTQKRRR